MASGELQLDADALSDVTAALMGLSSYISNAADVMPTSTGDARANQAITDFRQAGKAFGVDTGELLRARASQVEGISSSFSQLDAALGATAARLGSPGSSGPVSTGGFSYRDTRPDPLID